MSTKSEAGVAYIALLKVDSSLVVLLMISERCAAVSMYYGGVFRVLAWETTSDEPTFSKEIYATPAEQSMCLSAIVDAF